MAVKPERFSELRGAQHDASVPDAHVWLTASAGTGKTFVLAARVLRLLLQAGVRSDSILCLTFTRAGAAEMAERVHSRLAYWARLSDKALHDELFALGEARAPADIARARTLFAAVLDARGGGLRVMTIHAFCQTLLGSFPLEAGIAPGFRAIEGREQTALSTRVLAAMAARAEHDRDQTTIAALRALSLRLGEDGARGFLLRAARKAGALEAIGEGIEARVRRALGVPATFDQTHVSDACCDDRIDRQGLTDLMAMHAEWGTKNGQKAIDKISEWLLADPEARSANLDKLARAWATKEGKLIDKGPKHPDFDALVQTLHRWCSDLQKLKGRAVLARDVTHALQAARTYARAYADAKRAEGLVDFDDLIQKTVAVLHTPGISEWISYKLDQATDHILVDEAQDTNSDQWDIVEAVADEFWVTAPDATDRRRSFFSVGDYKQAIFGFQGTDPRHYSSAENRISDKASQGGRALARMALDRSFRSTPPVLDIVDAMLAELGPDAFGPEAVTLHQSARGGPGQVTLLPPVAAPAPELELDHDEEQFIDSATRALATRIAEQVRRWLDAGHRIESEDRAAEPGDVMILVRKRGDLAALLVARLQAAAVPVAGVDRLWLGAPLAVKDCMAAVRFAVQPEDDLTLACLLVSPICGWSQDLLFEAAHVPRAGSLWRHVRDHYDDAMATPRALLAMADRVSPYVFLETMLSGPIGARQALLRRLGNDAADPIDELLNAALDYEHEGVATLQGFVDWFDRGVAEIVRDPAGGGGAVRVMTVHAAKGLEAPIVILADTTTNPDGRHDDDLEWVLDETLVPLFRPPAAERQLHETFEVAALEQAARDRREHWRLLYVAMTRAQEQLLVVGPLTKLPISEASWHAAIERAMVAKGCAITTDPHWGTVRTHSSRARATGSKPRDTARPPALVDRPAWLDRPAPAEATPRRPLSPSSLGPDTVADPPSSSGQLAGAARGRLLHALFERLPPLEPGRRRAAAAAWLTTNAGVTDEALRDDIIEAALAVLDAPHHQTIFAPHGLAEVPIAGVVDGIVVAGTIDRLLVSETHVDVIDFKTQRRVPGSADAIMPAHLRQMAAYVAVLEGVFPDKAVRAWLLYASAPRLFELSTAQLAAHKPGLAGPQPKLPATG